jgi:hypothetical protein
MRNIYCLCGMIDNFFWQILIKIATELGFFYGKNDVFSLKVLVQLLVIISLANFFALSISSLLG